MGVIKYYSSPMLVCGDGRLLRSRTKTLLTSEENRVKFPHEFHKAMFDRFGHK